MSDRVNENANTLIKPLVTFSILSYNQEKYIKAAIEGAFSQNYSPIEFIFSDDCSTDGTFEVIKEMAESYSGPNKISVHRFDQNQGLVKHVHLVNEKSTGDIFVYAAGDDVSMPDRTSKIVEGFTDSNSPSLIISNAIKFDDSNQILGLLNPNSSEKVRINSTHPLDLIVPGFNGCTIAIRRELYTKFPEPFSYLIAEDTIHIRRAALLNGVTYLPEALVKYRIHDNNLSHKKIVTKQDYISNTLKWLNDIDTQYRQLKVDIESVSSMNVVDPRQKIRKYEESNRRRIKIIEGNFLQGLHSIAMEMYYIRDFNVAKEVSRMFVSRWFPRYMGYKNN